MSFDLIETQSAIRECADPKALYQRSEQIAKLYLTCKIGKYEHDECMDAIKSRLRDVEAIKKQINS